MAGVRTGIIGDSSLVNLSEIPLHKIRPEVFDFLVQGEDIIQCFETIRDQVIFTDKRIFVVNVQGITGKKISYFSYPYSKVLYFGIETAGVLDVDSELILTFANGDVLQFDFITAVDIKAICSKIQNYIL